MPFLLVRHNVEDFAEWRVAYEEHVRRLPVTVARGSRIFRSADNANEVMVLSEWRSLEEARRFARSDGLRQALQRAGVADQPEVYYLEEVG